MMTYSGHVKNGVIVLDEPATILEEGQTVQIVLNEVSSKPASKLSEQFKKFVGKAEGLPADASLRVDDYLYGSENR